MLRRPDLAVLVTAAVLAGCGGNGDPAHTANVTSHPESGSAPTAPTTPAKTTGCPRTAGGRAAKGVAISLGHGPAYPVLGMAATPPSPRGVASLVDDTHKHRVYYHKTLWAINRRAPSDVLIRANNYHGGRPVSFFDGRKQRRTLRLPRPPGAWGYAVTTTLLPGPGCYVFHVRGGGLDQRIIFQAELGPNRSPVSPARRLRLRRAPYLGVRCRKANSIPCDRVGLAVWLRAQPRRLTATIDGRRFRLHPPPTQTGFWEGTLHPARLLQPGAALHITPDQARYYWEGRHRVRTVVHLSAIDADGQQSSADVAVDLHAGYG